MGHPRVFRSRANRAIGRISRRTRHISRRTRNLSNKIARKVSSKTRTMSMTKHKKKGKSYEKIEQSPFGIVTNSSCIVPQNGNMRYNYDLLSKHSQIPVLDYVSQDYFTFQQGCGFQAVSNDDYTANNGYGIAITLGRGDGTIGAFYDSILPIYRNCLPAPLSSTLGASANKMLVTYASQKLTITNQESATCECEIFDIVARRDSLLSNDYSSPEKAWYHFGLASDASAASTQGTLNAVGASPFAVQAWCENFKVIKRTKLFLTPGQSHIHFQKSFVNNLFDVETLKGMRTIANKTSFCMVVVKGMPVTENSASVVSTAPVKCICLREVKVGVKLLASYRDLNSQNDNLTTLATPYSYPLAPQAKAAITSI